MKMKRRRSAFGGIRGGNPVRSAGVSAYKDNRSVRVQHSGEQKCTGKTDRAIRQQDQVMRG